jgi:hypothetical protein
MSAAFQDRKHMALFYDSDKQRDGEIIRFINEGLEGGQFCIYGTIHVRDKEYFQDMSSQIVDYEENVRKGNLLVVDFSPFYIAALTGDLTPYKQVQKQLEEMFERNKEMKVRYVGDATGLLFKNKHFDECAMVEEWWQGARIEAVTTLCLFQKSLLDEYPFNHHKHKIFANHDVAIGADDPETHLGLGEKG